MQKHTTPGIGEYPRMTTQELRNGYIASGLFELGRLTLVATDLDRAIVGGAVPTVEPLELTAPDSMRASFFCERRELGIINIGGPGTVDIDGQTFAAGPRECVYAGRGSRSVVFASDDKEQPARYYLLSYPAHAAYPAAKAGEADANVLNLGTADTCNERRLVQYIHEEGIKSSQLVMGFTEIKLGSAWNTMPPHTHDRRTEIYLYFDLADDHRVLHAMGTPDETRTLWVGSHDAVLSPAWSIHCGAGTGSYRFIWGMGGENQAFADMDGIAVSSLR